MCRLSALGKKNATCAQRDSMRCSRPRVTFSFCLLKRYHICLIWRLYKQNLISIMFDQFCLHMEMRFCLYSLQNQADVITLKKTATTVLRDFYKQPRNLDTEAEKLRVIKAEQTLYIVTSSQCQAPEKNIRIQPRLRTTETIFQRL